MYIEKIPFILEALSKNFILLLLFLKYLLMSSVAEKIKDWMDPLSYLFVTVVMFLCYVFL